MAQIEVKDLVKEYQRKRNPKGFLASLGSVFHTDYEVVRAVDHISFSIEKGEAVGYVGPNGCGKSTMIKMLCGILHPTAGEIRVDGLNPNRDRLKNNKKIGVVFGNRSLLWWDVPVIESYRLFQKMYEIPKARFEDNLEKFIEIMDIGSLMGVPERQLSLGQKMRCNIAAAFLHNPEIVYLDEPTIGLDTESKHSIRECIRRVNELEKTTFIVTSHDFQDIEMLCRRIILINHGKIVVDSEMQKVKREFNKEKLIKFEMENNPWHSGKAFEMEGVRVVSSAPYEIQLEYDTEKADSVAIINYVSKWCEIADIIISGRDIESIIRDMIKKDNAKGEN